MEKYSKLLHKTGAGMSDFYVFYSFPGTVKFIFIKNQDSKINFIVNVDSREDDKINFTMSKREKYSVKNI
ncbi:MAG: hypothetical protein NC115_06385 [Bacteroidales bacterium]|nr:hypothetical protein [Bacteroidales bacterium]